jgi:hypothetical protein
LPLCSFNQVSNADQHYLIAAAAASLLHHADGVPLSLGKEKIATALLEAQPKQAAPTWPAPILARVGQTTGDAGQSGSVAKGTCEA